MRRSFLLTLSVAALAVFACKGPKNGECKSSDDCKDQQGFGKVCVSGRCQECGADTDCQAGFACRDNKCAPRPECSTDTDCGAGKACQAGKCVASAPKAECDSDAQCGPNQSCNAGKCVAAQKKLTAAEQVDACGGAEHQVLFGFDKSDLDAQARGTLETMAGCLKGIQGARLVVEGHCDERGTTEYNLHLGERRAESVKKYLVNLGVDAKSVKTVSYGKEKPVCTESTEDCYAKNRRGLVRGDAGDRS